MKKSDRQKSMDYIKVYLGAINTGEVFYGSILAEYVNERLRANHQPDTIIKYARTLRQNGELNYKCIYKPEGKYVKL